MAATTDRAQKLLALVDIVGKAAQTVIQEWEKEDNLPMDKIPSSDYEGSRLPSHELYNARRTIVAACGSFVELVEEPQNRLLEVAAEYFESRALYIAAENHIADHLAKADPKVGLSSEELGKIVGIHPRKLSRVMRTLTSAHIFAEVQHNRFANNSVSAALVGDEPLRNYIMSFLQDIYTASDKLPQILRDPVKGQSFDVKVTAFQEALGTNLARWEWLEEGEKQADGTIKPRPALEVFSLAMLGSGRVFGTPLIHDYPWANLGKATIVDVAGGVGGFSLALAKKYSNLNFIVQDRPSVIAKAPGVWNKDYPEGITSGRVQFMEHNFFNDNPVKGAEVYILRYIIHDWEDDRCVDILKGIRAAMGPNSRILVADHVMNTTLGHDDLPSAPAPLPANYGHHMRLAHGRDLTVMSVINGQERTPQELKDVATRAGLEVRKIWECRGLVSITELRLPGSA